MAFCFSVCGAREKQRPCLSSKGVEGRKTTIAQSFVTGAAFSLNALAKKEWTLNNTMFSSHTRGRLLLRHTRVRATIS
jgi:hypothetical protein